MYVDYFGLRENPFSIAPDPAYLYMSDSHREALAHLLYGLKSDGGFVLLTGEIGTGKTTICRSLIDQVPADVDLAFVLNPKVTVCELLETICDELQIDRPGQGSIKALVDSLNVRLLETNAQGRKTVLVIDEAQNLSTDVLEQLRLLTNLETARRKLLQIILLGQPELRDMVNQPQMRQLAQRVTARYHLGPLEREDIAAYIQHRLQVAGCDRALFPAGAVKQVSRLSKGIPRLINLICDRALLGAYTLKKAQIDAAIVKQAGQEVFDLQPSVRVLPRLTVGLAGLLLTAGVVYGISSMSGLTASPVSPPSAEKLLPPRTDQQEPQRPLETMSPEIVASVQPSQAQPLQPEPPAAAQFSRTWPEPFGFTGSSAAAFRDLATLWGVNIPQQQDASCQLAAMNGLQCLDRRGSIDSLRGFGRPAVLTLYNDQGKAFYVLLSHLDDNRATFLANGEQQTLDVAALESRWFGEYRLLWQPPAQFQKALFPGGADSNVAWLAEQLDELGLYTRTGSELRLEGTLLGALKRFQFSEGLTPDGVLGTQTMIHLNRALATPGPRLQDTEVN